VMHELGMLDAFLKLPHQEVRDLSASFGGSKQPIADFRHVPTFSKFLALMPQWDFLNFLRRQGAAFPGFRVETSAEAVDLVREDGRISGVRVKTESGEHTVHADLFIAADGRHSTLRDRAGLEAQTFGASFDVLWMRIPKGKDAPLETLGIITPGHFLILIDRDAYYQAAFIIPKDAYPQIQSAGIDAFRATIARMAPYLQDTIDALKSFDDVSLLTVTVDRLPQWSLPNFLCIGDAAHAMSPIGGVGINLALQDAIAAANALAAPLRTGPVDQSVLRAVQARRTFPVVVIQRLQVFLQDHVVLPILRNEKPVRVPFMLRLLQYIPMLRRIPAYVIGVGVRPEHVRTPVA